MAPRTRLRPRASVRSFGVAVTACLALVMGLLAAPPAVASAVAASAPSAVAPTGIEKTADLSKFQAGNIISDSVFYNSGTMSEAQIQAFLQARVPACEAGYTCLKDWYDTSRTTAADAMCDAYAGGTRERASTIIYKVAQACGINPQVILATLEKEQGLVTHVWPSEWRYTIAMGQGCPDTAACDTKYYGFFNQVYGAAWQFKRYGNPAGTSQYFTWYAPGSTWNVRWSPDASCGSSPVYIQNQATASLYYYTPYQPNAASLAAGRGTGDACSTYGNRNFYNNFTDWFGSTLRNPCDQPPYEQVRGASGTMKTNAVVPARQSSYTTCNDGALWLDKDSVVSISAEWGEWYWVNVTGHMLWIQKSSLVSVDPCEQPPYSQVRGATGQMQTTAVVPARASASAFCNAGALWLDKGTTVTLSAQWGDWYWVNVTGHMLWIEKPSLIAVVNVCDQPPYNEVSGASGSYATASAVTARSTANAACSTGAVDLPAGAPVTLSAQWGDWYWVNSNGTMLWLPKSSVTSAAACTQPPYEQVRGASGTATVTKDTTARTGPYAACSADTVALTAGATVALSAQWGDWYWAKAGTRMLWLPGADVSTASVPTTMTTTAGVNLRSAPSLTATILTTLPTGTVVTVIGSNPEWYNVRVGTRTGWVNAAYLR